MNNDKYSVDHNDLDEFVELPKKAEKETGELSRNNIYRKNLEALEKHHPELVEMVESVVIDKEKIRMLSSESGRQRIVYTRDNGEEINIHSAEDPVVCAGQAIELLGNIEKEGIIALFGFGFGYFAEEVFEMFEKGHLLLVYEATTEIFKFAMCSKDISRLLGSDKVKIILGEDADNFSVLHSHHHLIVNGKFWVVEHKPSVKINPEAYDNFYRRLDEEKSLTDIGVTTIIGRGKEFINSFLENVPSVIRRQGVNELRNIFKGRPAVIVSAGPSLEKNMHLLKKIKGKAVVIATDASLPTLLSADIIPDIAVAIDPVSDNIEDKFRDIPVLKKLPFICLAQYTPKLLRMYPDHLFINSVPHNMAYQWLGRFWEDKGYIESFGGSVAHLAFSAAEFMGADIITFAGQDLSYAGDRIHARGYSDTLDRLLVDESKKGAGSIPGSFLVKDIFNETVHTIRQFATFKTSFENKIKEFRGLVINATEGGLSIEGAVNMRLADFINEYCNDLKEIDTFSILSGLSNISTDYRFELLIDELVRTRDKYNEIKKNSGQILKYIKRVKGLQKKGPKDSPELNNILSKVGMLTEKVKHPSLNLLAAYNYGLELYLKKQDTQNIDSIEDKWDKLDKQLERGQIYYKTIIKTISLFNKQLDNLIKALNQEKELDSILNDESIDMKERNYRAAMNCRRNGMIAQAVKYLEEAVEAQQTSVSRQKIKLCLAEMYMEQFRYYETLEILTRGSEQEPWGKEEGKVFELIRACNKKINEWESKQGVMNKLMEEAEANYGSHLESGYFYFRINDFERAKKAYLKAIEEWQEVKGKGQGAKDQSSVNSHLSSAYYGLAHIYLSKDDPENAVNALEKAMEIEPGNPVFYRDLGFISFNNNDITSAEIFFTKAIELSPQTADLYKPLADLYMTNGEREKALDIYERALKANPDAPLIKQELAKLLGEKISEAGIC